MAITLTSTINWAAPFLQFKPQTLGSSNTEPAVTSANIILSTMLGPPFKWRWNRTTLNITTNVGTQDYLSNVSDFGFLESASIATSNATTFELSNNRLFLPISNQQARPEFIAPTTESGGNITFRFLSVPNTASNVTVTYQKKATLMSNVNSTWAPIPDEYSYIYNHGYLGLMFMYADDPRFNVEIGRFKASLIGASEGLTQTEKDVFLEQWMIEGRQKQAYAIDTQQGATGRNL